MCGSDDRFCSSAQRCYAIIEPSACDAFRACEETVLRCTCSVEGCTVYNSWVRSHVCCPDNRAAEDTLIPKVWIFGVDNMKFYDPRLFAAASPRAAAALGDHTYIQSRAASWDSSGSKEISQSGLRFCESSGFRGDGWVRIFQSTEDGGNASIVCPSGLGGAADFSMFQLEVQGMIHINGTDQSPCAPCCRVSFVRW